jgi:quercetin dioxygenase-like cupin family protein
MMRRWQVGFSLCGVVLSFASVVLAQSAPVGAPTIVNARTVTFTSPPQIPGLSAAWAIGNEKGPGPYLLLVELKEGAKIRPHHHPDPRIMTVFSGKLAVGFGDSFNEGSMTVVSSGDSFLVPANVPHYSQAQGGDVEYQECGQSPTGTVFVERR